MKPKVSILIAAYNAEKYIDRALASVAAQSFTDWEVVAVDDGSSDDTGRRLHEWARKDVRIRVHHNDANLGIGATRKVTLALAQGYYAAVLDADDVALPEWLAARVNDLDQDPEVVLVSGSRILIDAADTHLRVTHEGASPELLRWKLIFGNPINQPSCMFRVESAHKVGGYLSYSYLEDWDLFVRLCEIGKLVQRDDAHMMYRVHVSNTSLSVGTDRERLAPAVAKIMRRSVQASTGLMVPGDLVWHLFRGRRVFRGDPATGREALSFLCEAHRRFREYKGGREEACAIGAAALEDAANVLRCGGWSPTTAVKSVAAITRTARIRGFSTRHVLFNALKVLLLPAASAIGRARSRKSRHC